MQINDDAWMYEAPTKWANIDDKYRNKNMSDFKEEKTYKTEDMRGAAFPKKEGDPEWYAPYSGHIMVDGNKYWISIYNNTSKKGDPYLGLKVKPADDIKW